MATKKSNKKSARKKADRDKRARPLTGEELEREAAEIKRRLRQIPPIIVGGGGSVFVALRNSANPRKVTPPPSFLPPNVAVHYTCYKLDTNIQSLLFDDGQNPGESHEVRNSGRHKIVLSGD